jgi:Asp-tRNA(Asn)/Glu-tRNA(Gln) amidotransferase A subunit family amidase
MTSRLLGQGKVFALELVRSSLAAAKRSRNRNTYLSLNAHALEEAARADGKRRRRGAARPALDGIPISVKDLFDVAGMTTTCGSPFQAELGGVARHDAAYVARWRRTGALVVGKTHLNEFAYGLTGENRTWGPCLQPDRPDRLTGGSSSGAAASVLEGSAFIGLGTDTGGSIRVPAALCGLVGFRHTPARRVVRGLFPLAPSFDSCGWLQRDLADFPLVYAALTGKDVANLNLQHVRLGLLGGRWLDVCEAPVLSAYEATARWLQRKGTTVIPLDADAFLPTADLFAALQACEAARVHKASLKHPARIYDPAIRARLEWGLSISRKEESRLRQELEQFCGRMHLHWQTCDFIAAPACPFTELKAGADHAGKRNAILQITCPFSLAQLPALAIPAPGSGADRPCGVQIATRRYREIELAGLAASLTQAGFHR